MGQKFLDEYLAPKMQQPQLPPMGGGAQSLDQAMATGTFQMPGQQFSPIDRWLPVIGALGGALSTPMTPTQPLAPLGGALQGFGQGRLEQIQLERQAAAPYQQVALDMYARQREAALTKQVNQQKANDLRTQAAGLDPSDPRRQTLLDEAALLEANVPEAARFVIPRPESEAQVKEREARTKSAEATADWRKRQAGGDTAPSGKEQRASFGKAVASVGTAYRNDPVIKNNPAPMSRAEWYQTDAGKQTLKDAALMAGMSEYEFRTKMQAPNAVLSDEKIKEIQDAPDTDTFNLPGDSKVYTKAEMLKLLGLSPQ